MDSKGDYSIIILVTLKLMIDKSIIKIAEEIITSYQLNESTNCINSKDPKGFIVLQWIK